MASVFKEITVNADPGAVWDAVRDVGAVHRRLCPGVLTDARLEPGCRVVTFANGLVVRELIVDIDDARRRLAYAAVGGRATHHNAAIQVLAAGDGTSRIEWTIDVLPDEMAAPVAGLMAQGAQAMQAALGFRGG